MKLSPLDIYNKEFRKKISFWAYDERDVDEFLDHIAAAYERVLKEKSQLKEENERLHGELNKFLQMEQTLQDTMVVAKETVKDRKNQAEREAQNIVEAAKNRSREIMNDAKEKVRERMKQFRRIEEYEQFFRVRLKSIIDSHLQLLQESKIDQSEEIEILKKELAFSSEEPDEKEVKNWFTDEIDSEENYWGGEEE